MGKYIQVLALITIGVMLLWFGYTLLIGQFAGIRLSWLKRKQEKTGRTGSPGDPQVCPVCSVRLNKGYLVKSHAFPSLTGGRDRLMHIRGCVYCMNGERERRCPVCGSTLAHNDILIARMFERSPQRNHVHVLGCSQCKRVGKLMG